MAPCQLVRIVGKGAFDLALVVEVKDFGGETTAGSPIVEGDAIDANQRRQRLSVHLIGMVRAARLAARWKRRCLLAAFGPAQTFAEPPVALKGKDRPSILSPVPIGPIAVAAPVARLMR